MNILFSEKIPGTYGIEHIIYMITVLVLMFVGWFIIAKYVKNEKTKKLIVKISAAVLLLCILWNRISLTIYNFKHHDESFFRNILTLIPLSFCGSASLFNSLATLCGKKDNKVLHCVSYYGLIGGIITIFYPDFLDEQTFLDPRTISGLLHHTVLVWVVVTNMITGYFTPTTKKWYIYPIGLCMLMTYGLFFKEAFGLGAMQIEDPLLKGAPIFTSWYIVGLLSMVVQFVIMIGFEKFKNKKTFKEIFSKESWI